jgi:hypothetical protein
MKEPEQSTQQDTPRVLSWTAMVMNKNVFCLFSMHHTDQ